MCVSKKIIFLCVLAALTACAPGTTTHPVLVDIAPSPAPTPYTPQAIADAEQGLRSALGEYKKGNFELVLTIARQVTDAYPGTAWYQRSLFLTEQALIQLDRDAEADSALLRVQAEYPELADYSVSLLADYHYSKERYTRAAALYQHLLHQHPGSSLTAHATYQYARALFNASSCCLASEAFENFLQAFPRSESAPDAGTGLGRALLAEARPLAAIRAFRNVSIRYPGTGADQEAAKALAELLANGLEVPDYTNDELFERGMNLFRTNQHAKSVETFKALLERDTDLPSRPEVLLKTGISLYNLGKRSEAAVVLEKMVTDYPSYERVTEAMTWIGKSYSKMGAREQGLSAFLKIVDSYPDCEWADDALFYIGNMYREVNDAKMALKFYGRVAQEYPQSRFADSALWWNAWAYYGARDYEKAGQAMLELVSRYPRSFLANQARYWQGRIAEQRGDLVRAGVYYGRVLQKGPYTYYGHRAAERMASLTVPQDAVPADILVEAVPVCAEEPCSGGSPSSTDTDDGPPVWIEETQQLLAAEPAFRKTLELMHLDMRTEAASELWLLQDRLPRKSGAYIGLSKAFFDLGDYYRSLIIVLRNYPQYFDGQAREMPTDFWLLAYPRGYWDSVVLYSKKYSLDPYFVAAIIRQESQFHAEALSPAGARGVMQVMPQTGEWVARSAGVRGFDSSQLYVPDTAIHLGAWYINFLMKRFKGDLLYVAAAYNAGPEAVASWLGQNSFGKERDVFVESIPFSETRGYVKKVFRNYAEYKRIYGRPNPAPAPAPVVPDSAPNISPRIP